MFLKQFKLGHLGELFDGPHATPKRQDVGPYFLNISSLVNGRLDLAQSDHVSIEDFVQWTRRVTPQNGDLLFSYETRLGDAALMPAGVMACLGRRMALIRPDRNLVDPRFLLYFYLSPEFQALIDRHTIHGATVNRIALSTMGSWQVSIPKVGEQRAISGVLGALDDKIAANVKQVDQLAALASAKFEEALMAGSSECALSDITMLITRGIAPAYSDLEDATTVLNQKCIRNQVVLLEPARRTLRHRVQKSKLLQPKDVLVNSTGVGTLGRIARWNLSVAATVDSHISIVRFDDRMVEPTCAGYGLLRLQSIVEQMGEGSTGQTELSRSELGKLQIRLPFRNAQGALGAQLTALSALQDAKRRESATLAEFRDTLLPGLISGRLRVDDVEQSLGGEVL